MQGQKWEPYAPGRVIISSGTYKDSRGETKIFKLNDKDTGEYQHLLIEEQIPKHSHHLKTWYTGNSNDNTLVDSGAHVMTIYENKVHPNGPWTYKTGGGEVHNNMQPYAVANVWQRTE